MPNLQIEPAEHFRKHVESGKKLDIGNIPPCLDCDGYGYIKNYNGFELCPEWKCVHCNGSGKEPSDA